MDWYSFPFFHSCFSWLYFWKEIITLQIKRHWYFNPKRLWSKLEDTSGFFLKNWSTNDLFYYNIIYAVLYLDWTRQLPQTSKITQNLKDQQTDHIWELLMTAYKRPALIISVRIMLNSFILISLYLLPHPISYFPLVYQKIARLNFLLISESCLSFDTVGFCNSH